VREKFETGAEQMVPVFRKIGEQTLALLTNVGFAILIPILGFFFLKDGHRVRAAVLAQFAAGEQRALIEGILADVHVLLGQYIRALVILSLATFVFYAIYFEITGVPYAILLSGVAALLEFIPVIGPLSAAVITIVVALFSGYQHVLGLLMFFIAYRLFQDYVLQPFLFGAGVQLHPLLVIFGVLAGEEVAGVRGMFLSIPLLAILRVVYVRMQRSRLSQPEVVPTT
jgi:predicted PurR-regulated permease PerM